MAEDIAGGQTEFTATAEWDLSAKQYRAVQLGSAGTSKINVKVASQAGIKCIGVLQNKPVSGQAARVRFSGPGKMVAGTAITINDNIDTDANGYARTAVGSNILAIALETCVASATCRVLITPQVAL